MRLHSLEITAFGPFAEPVSVDFDTLSGAGLFLLCGPTGAGKTSVLDAVCFALYGDVPGDRSDAKRLRADHALEGVAPRVVLEATLSGRRFRIARSPAWERPKKRGHGTTTQQASVSLSERVDGEWQSLSTRLDETGHQVTHLVGMNLPQFCQVALLPQGRFQAFLRARSEERHKLLQQLFRTGRFEDVEKWLRERRRSLQQESARAHQNVADLVSRVSEVTTRRLPDDWDIQDLLLPADSGELATWSDGQVSASAAELEALSEKLDSVTTAEAQARTAHEEGRRLADQRARHLRATDERARLEQDAASVAVARSSLAAARRARVVGPLHRLERTAEDQRDRAAAAYADHAASVAEQLGVLDGGLLDTATLDDAHRSASDAASRVRALLPDEAELDRLTAAIAAGEEHLQALGVEAEELRSREVSLPARVAELRKQQAEATIAATELSTVRAQIVSLEQQLRAATELPVLRTELEAADALLTEAAAATLHRKEAWLDVREARIDGMAAEIAVALAVGDSCPVCGSADHPHPAAPAPGAPDAAAEKQARRLLDDAEVAQLAHDENVRHLTTRIAVTEQAAGAHPAEETQAQLTETRSRLVALESRATQLDPAAAALARAEAAQTQVRDKLQSVQLTTASLEAAVAARQEELTAVARRVASTLDGTGCADLTSLLTAHTRAAEQLREARSALESLERAETALSEARRTLTDAAAESGFDSVSAAVAALLPNDEMIRLERDLKAYDDRLASARSVLEDPELIAAAAADTPDLPTLESTHRECAAALLDTQSRVNVVSARASRLTGLHTGLLAALDAWAPVRSALTLTTRLAAFVEGKSPDNRLQMRLSAYVLAYRLTQVVAAANERLARMSDQRYSLEHTGNRAAGETRGGLSLSVRDDWSGEARDPATLSGGETFVVSLALALGLADVITQEAGGADLDTLFVDEGFGSLDADTLDDVMDTLDSLRDGGRVVGIVSHVPELRTRIPMQLQVDKSRDGSTLRHVRSSA